MSQSDSLYDTGYWAGFIDGEGCFRVHSTPLVTVVNTHLPTLEVLHRWAGCGTLACHGVSGPNRRPSWRWYACGENARNIIRRLIPRLQEKRRQAELCLEWSATPSRTQRRLDIVKELARLKRISWPQGS